MIAGGGPLGGGGKPGGGTVMGNPTREEERINTLKTIKLSKLRVKSDQLRKKKNDDDAELTGWGDERGCSADVGWWREERRRWYVWRKWSRREEGRYLSCSCVSI